MLEAMAAPVITCAAPAAGGALIYRLMATRAPRPAYRGLAVGQIPLVARRRRVMAGRREVHA